MLTVYLRIFLNCMSGFIKEFNSKNKLISRCKVLKQIITIFSNFKDKIKHDSPGKVKVLLKDLCLDLILPFNLKLFNLFLMFF